MMLGLVRVRVRVRVCVCLGLVFVTLAARVCVCELCKRVVRVLLAETTVLQTDQPIYYMGQPINVSFTTSPWFVFVFCSIMTFCSRCALCLFPLSVQTNEQTLQQQAW